MMFSKTANWWSEIFPVLQSAPELTKKVVEAVADIFGRTGHVFMQSLSENQLEELYRYVETLYPISEDIDFESRVMLVSGRYAIQNWREAILNFFLSFGSLEAIDAVKRLRNSFPKNRNLQSIYERVLEKYREDSWQPISPSELLQITHKASLRADPYIQQFNKLGFSIAQIISSQNETNRLQIQTVQSLMRQQKISEAEEQQMARYIDEVLEEIRRLPSAFDNNLQQFASEITSLHDSTYRQSGFLEVTIPIIPSIVAIKYEAGLDATSNIPKLIKAIRELWDEWSG